MTLPKSFIGFISCRQTNKAAPALGSSAFIWICQQVWIFAIIHDAKKTFKADGKTFFIYLWNMFEQFFRNSFAIHHPLPELFRAQASLSGYTIFIWLEFSAWWVREPIRLSRCIHFWNSKSVVTNANLFRSQYLNTFQSIVHIKKMVYHEMVWQKKYNEQILSE